MAKQHVARLTVIYFPTISSCKNYYFFNVQVVANCVCVWGIQSQKCHQTFKIMPPNTILEFRRTANLCWGPSKICRVMLYIISTPYSVESCFKLFGWQRNVGGN